jgi:McrBC 5-methylcytosine restriction system component
VMSASRAGERAEPRREVRKPRPRVPQVHLGAAPHSRSLLHASDCGEPVVVEPAPYIAAAREPGWGPYLDGFLSRNRAAIQALGIEARVVPGRDGVRLELQPGMRAGAIPLRSAVTGVVAGGVIVVPRFGWPGVGQVLATTGWGSGPEFLDQPLVPGSGREVPPWVLAGPVLCRLAGLLANLRPGYREHLEVRTHPRGQIQWQTYLTTQLPGGRWHQLPCRFSELDTDTRLRQAVRWTLERLRGDLGGTAGADPIGLLLIAQVVRLLEQVSDVPARRPDRRDLEVNTRLDPMQSVMLREGLRAMGWIVDERGLGGGRTSDGLAWTLPLEQLWERCVESTVRKEAALTGGQVRAGRSGETTVPLAWSDRRHRALGHLVPDFVVYRPDSIEIVDAKYKSHFAELDANSWHAFADDARDSMRADIHQVLAYAAACGSADTIGATLVYPVRRELLEELQARRRAVSEVLIPVGSRQIKLRIRALAFGAG